MAHLPHSQRGGCGCRATVYAPSPLSYRRFGELTEFSQRGTVVALLFVVLRKANVHLCRDVERI
ncbi:MAG TPA: hypothetical protein VJ842_00360 [Pyrinomonadaceae bacterium]|nr:hypothetical protein [Pyrinomonadaceae bacterium]